MEAFKAFEHAIETLKTVKMPGTYRQQLTHELTYFKNQSLCESDRRDSHMAVLRRWHSFIEADRQLNLLHAVKAKTEIWKEMQYSVGADRPISGYGKISTMHPPEVSLGKYEKWTAEDLLRHLEHQVLKKRKLEETHWRLMIIGIIYLHAESRRPRIHRDEKHLRTVYQWIHPYLKAAGLMEEFKSEKALIRRFKAFIASQIV